MGPVTGGGGRSETGIVADSCTVCGLRCASTTTHDALNPSCPWTVYRSRIGGGGGGGGKFEFYCEICTNTSGVILVFICGHAVCVPCGSALCPFRCPFCRLVTSSYLIDPEDEDDDETTGGEDLYFCTNLVRNHIYAGPGDRCAACGAPGIKLYVDRREVAVARSSSSSSSSGGILRYRPPAITAKIRRIFQDVDDDTKLKLLRRRFFS